MMVDIIFSITLISSMILIVGSPCVPLNYVPTSYDAENGDGNGINPSKNAESIAVTGVVDSENIPSSREMTSIYDYEDYTLVGTIDYSDSSESPFGNVSLQDIPEIYRGLFWNSSQLQDRWPEFYDPVDRQNTTSGTDTSDSAHSIKPEDGDQCCATKMDHYRFTSLLNEKGEKRKIVNTTDLQQHIPIGKCARSSGFCCGNPGLCMTINVSITVLVWSPDSKRIPPVEFDWFDLPHHCSCVNAVP